jgi:biotin-(acetyl-CoA carboxylase) ligase/methylase of polypeptide subunit release factors
MKKGSDEYQSGGTLDLSSRSIILDSKNENKIELLIPKTVYPPREDSKLLFDIVKNISGTKKSAVEIGCGTGIISIILAENGWKVYSFDINPYAVISTKENAQRASVGGLVSVKEGGVGEETFTIPKETKLIVWNLPYLTPPKENEPKLEWIEEASMSDLKDEGWGHRLVELIESQKDELDPEILILLLQRKYPLSPSSTEKWTNLGWSHRVLEAQWLFDEKIEVVAYWKPGLGVPIKNIEECESTMDEAKKLPKKGWQRIITKRQNLGRGRRGDSWISKNEDLLATWSIRKTILGEISPGLLQVAVGARIANVIEQYSKWPNDIVDSEGNKIGGVLFEMDSENETLRIGLGINQFDGVVEGKKVTGWRKNAPNMNLETLFSIIDSELSTIFEEHPLLNNNINEGEIKEKAWNSMSKLISRGYSLKAKEREVRIIEMNKQGELAVFSDEEVIIIQNIEDLRWSF